VECDGIAIYIHEYHIFMSMPNVKRATTYLKIISYYVPLIILTVNLFHPEF